MSESRLPRSSRTEQEQGTIVVGVDHSAGAKAALRFALEEARIRHARLRAVHAWQLGYVSAAGLANPYTTFDPDIDDVRAAADTSLETTPGEGISAPRSVEIERCVVEGVPAAVLIAESRGADLLVVGSRGHGGFAQLLLGSVSQQCVHHAECPVAIVRAKPGAR
jgi:nucleotide-binding universal stress UspA family protein